MFPSGEKGRHQGMGKGASGPYKPGMGKGASGPYLPGMGKGASGPYLPGWIPLGEKGKHPV